MAFDQDQQPHDDVFQPEDAGARRAPPTNNVFRNIAIGCGCLALLLAIVAIGLGIWVRQNWKGVAADFAKQVSEQVVKDSELAPAEKTRVLDRLNQLADDFKTGKINPEQMGHVFEKVAQSPLFPIAMVMIAEKQYVAPSGLTPEEKLAASRTLQRLARGSFEKTISSEKLQEVLSVIQIDQGHGQKKMKEKLTDDELKDFLAKAQQAADEAAVPDEAFGVNIADELDKAIDEALKK